MQDFEHLDYYQLLGVARSASAEEIKHAYRKQISQYHPDRYASASQADRDYAGLRTQRINEAYRVLSNATTRSAYNRGQLSSASRAGKSSGDIFPEGPRSAPRRPAPRRDHQAELYEQACTHLQAKRYVQAAATLRELQQINPFYRDSATLLAQAEAGGRQGGAARPADEHVADTFRSESLPAQQRRKWLLISGAGGVVVLGIVAALFGLPQIQATGVVGSMPNASPTDTSAAEPVFVSAEAQSTTAQPTEPAPTEAVPTEPVPAEAQPTELPPTEVPTATPAPPTPSPTPGVLAEQGTLLFVDDFEGSGGPGWADQQGNGWTVGYGNGYYRITTIPGPGNIWSYRTAFEAQENFSLGCDVQVLSGAGGLVMRFVDRQSYVAFLVNPADGSYRLQQHSTGTIQVVAQGNSEAIVGGSGAINRLAARLEGNRIQGFVNNQRVADVQLPGVVPTNVYGLVAYGQDTPAEVLFDNLEIRALE